MNRAFLCSAIEGLVSPYGYHFTMNDESCYPTTVSRYPAAFMLPPEFVGIEGRRRGRITYKVTLRLSRQGAKFSPTERNSLLAEMEQQLTEMFVALSRSERVAVVENLTIRPVAGVVDHHGAIAMEAQAKIETIF